ncbi:MAG: hypothetical protein RL217_1926 [Pseudomonadota bacterium]|jgi:hypothetical protein
MINSISNANKAPLSILNKTHSPASESIKKATETNSSPVKNIDTRASAIQFIQSATPKELEAKVNSLIGREPTLAAINLNELKNSSNGEEVINRIRRLSENIHLESSRVLAQEQALIKQGKAEGKSDKEILISIVKMQDQQSDLYKMATLWGTDGLSSPNNYKNLVELTSSYLNTFA